MSEVKRAALYLRVSTARQAEVDLSIPDQLSQTKAYCQRQGWCVVAEYTEPGASAMDDNRPEFQKMIERACDTDRPIDVIVVHSFSRFFRDAFGLEMYVRKLAKHNVKLVSITQELGDDPAQVMMRQVIALFDEYQSRENGKHVLRAMNENARQGFYNGSTLPLGYTVVEIEKRGHRIKKRFAIDPVEAETVKLIYQLYLDGDGSSGPMGVKAVTKALNEKGLRTRLGARFGVASTHRVLTNPMYAGRARFNRKESKTGRIKPANDIVEFEAPRIIEPAEFERVQQSLKTRSPRIIPPRITTSSILLSGLAYCATCDGPMTLRTGTSRSGKMYRYYTCSTSVRMGKTACKGRSFPMDRLDELVTEHVKRRVLEPARLGELLQSLKTHRKDEDAEVKTRLQKLSSEAARADEKIDRLYRMVEDGITEMDDLLAARLSSLKADRERAKMALERAQFQTRPEISIHADDIQRFADLMAEKITSGDASFRRSYLRSIIETVEVGDNVIRIRGSKTSLEQAVTSGDGMGKGVRGFIRKWRPRQDSNLRPTA